MVQKIKASFALGGSFVVKPITEGYERKGGMNAAISKIPTRPPAPAPMKNLPRVLQPAKSGG